MPSSYAEIQTLPLFNKAVAEEMERAMFENVKGLIQFVLPDDSLPLPAKELYKLCSKSSDTESCLHDKGQRRWANWPGAGSNSDKQRESYLNSIGNRVKQAMLKKNKAKTILQHLSEVWRR